MKNMKMKENINFLKIPINRIIALILMDIMSIVLASFAAIYILIPTAVLIVWELIRHIFLLT